MDSEHKSRHSISKYPQSWDEVIKQGLEDKNDSEDDDKKLYALPALYPTTSHSNILQINAEMLRDPLGVGSASTANIPALLKGNAQLDWREKSFSPVRYLLAFHKATTLHDLKEGKKTVALKVGDQKSQLKTLVQSHFHRFVGFQAAMQELDHFLAEKLGFTTSLHNLQHSLESARGTLGESFDSLIELKATIHSHQQKLDLLTHFKFRFMINLPKVMKEDMDKKEYLRVTLHYMRIKEWLQQSEVAMFRQVLYTAEDIINDLRAILFATLASRDPSEGRKHDEAIRLLITIGTGENKETEDPAWYCLTGRYHTMERLLGHELANTKTHKTPAESVKSVRRLSSILQELLPGFWTIAYAFYREEYHSQAQLPQEAIDHIMARYPEERFHHYLNQIIHLYCDAIRKKYYKKAEQPAEGKRFRAATKRLYHSNEVERGESEPIGSVDERVWRKEYIEAVASVVVLVKDQLKISKFFSAPLLSLYDDMTASYITSTFTQALESAKRLHLLENWEIRSRQRMITLLPIEFEELIVRLLAELKDLQLREGETLNLCRQYVVSYLNTFADNVQHLSQMSPLTGPKLLQLLNNLSFVQTTVTPNLIARFCQDFKCKWNDADSAALNCYGQLLEMVVTQYAKSKFLSLTKLIKYSFLIEGYNWTRNTLNKSGIRSYVFELLLDIVVIHEELAKLTDRNGRDYVILLCIECIFQSYCEWIKEVDEFSLHGLAQLSMEVQFVDLILKQRLMSKFETNGPHDENNGQSYVNAYLQRCFALQQSIPNIIAEVLNLLRPKNVSHHSGKESRHEHKSDANPDFSLEIKKDMERNIKHSLDSTHLLYSCLRSPVQGNG